MTTETLQLILNAQDNASGAIQMVGQQLGAVADEADEAMSSIEGVNTDIQKTGADAQEAGAQGTAAILPLGGAFAALGPKVLAAGAAFIGVGVGVSTLAKASTGLFNLWRESEVTLDRFRLALANTGANADQVDERLRTLRDTVRYSTLTAFNEAEPRIANLFAQLGTNAEARVGELAESLANLKVLTEGDALTFALQLELGTPDFSSIETVAQGLGLSEGALGLENIFNDETQGRVNALNDYIENQIVPNLGAWTQATLELDKQWDAFLGVLGNPLEGLFTPLVRAASSLFEFLTNNWTIVWNALKGVALSGLIAIGDAFTGGLVSFGISLYNWVEGLVRLAPRFYAVATEWARSLWSGLTDWLETAAQSVGGFFADLFSGDLFGDISRAPQSYGPPTSGYGPQEQDINIRLELDGEVLGRQTVRLLGNQFGRRVPGAGAIR